MSKYASDTTLLIPSPCPVVDRDRPYNHLYGSIGPKELAVKTGIDEKMFSLHYKEIGHYTLKLAFPDGIAISVNVVINKE